MKKGKILFKGNVCFELQRDVTDLELGDFIDGVDIGIYPDPEMIAVVKGKCYSDIKEFGMLPKIASLRSTITSSDVTVGSVIDVTNKGKMIEGAQDLKITRAWDFEVSDNGDYLINGDKLHDTTFYRIRMHLSPQKITEVAKPGFKGKLVTWSKYVNYTRSK